VFDLPLGSFVVTHFEFIGCQPATLSCGKVAEGDLDKVWLIQPHSPQVLTFQAFPMHFCFQQGRS